MAGEEWFETRWGEVSPRESNPASAGAIPNGDHAEEEQVKLLTWEMSTIRR